MLSEKSHDGSLKRLSVLTLRASRVLRLNLWVMKLGSIPLSWIRKISFVNVKIYNCQKLRGCIKFKVTLTTISNIS